jgi:hypothetical protein
MRSSVATAVPVVVAPAIVKVGLPVRVDGADIHRGTRGSVAVAGLVRQGSTSKDEWKSSHGIGKGGL